MRWKHSAELTMTPMSMLSVRWVEILTKFPQTKVSSTKLRRSWPTAHEWDRGFSPRAIRSTIMGSKNRKTKQAFPLCSVVLKPTQGSGFSCSVPQPLPAQRKKTVLNAATIPRLTGQGSPPNLESVCSTSPTIRP